MRAQICFFVSIAFSFVAWGVVTGSLILPELRRRGRNEALRPLLMFHSSASSAWRSWSPASCPPICRRCRRRRRLRRYRRRGAADAGVAARQAWHRRGLGIQPLGQRRHHHANYEGIRLGVQPPVKSALPTFCRNVYRVAFSDHARTHVLASTTKRKRSRRAGRAAARLK